MVIIPTDCRFNGRAKKTQAIMAKLAADIVVDSTMMSVLLLDTLEGKEPIHKDNFICKGAAGDYWQQSQSALLKKYMISGVDYHGWLICDPRPENEVEYFELQKNMVGMDSSQDGEFLIQGLYGESIMGVPNLQRIKIGDFVCRNPLNHEDQWVVRKHLFLNTYFKLS